MKALIVPLMLGVFLIHVPLPTENVTFNKELGRESRTFVEPSAKRPYIGLQAGPPVTNPNIGSKVENVALTPDMPAGSFVQRDQSSIVRILTDPALWGRDFATALASMANWKESGEARVYIFPNQMVSAAPDKGQEETKRTADSLSSSLKARQPQLKPQFLNQRRRANAALRVEVLARFEDDSPHIALTGPSLQFLASRLTVATLRSRLGPPEKVTRVVIQNERERRGVVLTIYSYAGGAIEFAEADYAPIHGVIDRVILDVSTVSTAVF